MKMPNAAVERPPMILIFRRFADWRSLKALVRRYESTGDLRDATAVLGPVPTMVSLPAAMEG